MAEAARLRLQAEGLRELAEAKDQEAEGLEAEAAALLAKTIEARNEASRLRTEAEAFLAQAQAAEALAAEYRALAENLPAAQIATHYLYDPAGRLLGEYDNEGQIKREYVYLDDLPIAQLSGTAIAYIHTDPLGTPESLTDQDQTLVWQAHRDPFGRTTVTTQAIEHNLRFPGQYFDAETGLHYNYFRDYDPNVGRYIESDPIGLAGGINTYTYVGGNPINWLDPFGLAIGDYPPAPPGYDPASWVQGQWSNGKHYLRDPDGRVLTLHPEDRGHWRHWDKQGPGGGDEGPWPPNSGKPRPGQKNLKPNQCPTDPSGDAPPWQPLDPEELGIEGDPLFSPFPYTPFNPYSSPGPVRSPFFTPSPVLP